MDHAKELFYAQQALQALFSVTNKLQMQGDKYLQDITIRQLLAVPAIFHAPDNKASINHIAKQLGTTKQNAKQIVAALVKKQYLAMAPNEEDKRAVNVTVTAEGKRAFQACSQRADEFLADIFHEFTAQELETFCAFLQKLYRFDGSEPEGLAKGRAYNAQQAEIVLAHHEHFLRRKAAGPRNPQDSGKEHP